MYRISLIIGEIYSKYLPFAEKNQISLNLDISDPSLLTDDPDQIKQEIDNHLSSALQRSRGGEITIAIHNKTLSITDNGTILSKTACKLLSHGRISVTSRIGFGTTVSINIAKENGQSEPN